MSDSETKVEKSGERTPLLSKGSESELEESGSSISTLPPEEKRRIHNWTSIFVALVVFVIVAAVTAIVVVSVWSRLGTTHGVVNSQAEECSQIGADTLRKGGHAVDAAIATFLCLGVVTAQSGGIGGGGFMLIKDGSGYHALDFRDTAPQSATSDMFASNETLSEIGGLAVAVPGALRGMHVAWKRFGRLAWEELFQPTIDLSRDGFFVTSFTAELVTKELNGKLAYSSQLRDIYVPGGIPVRESDVLHRPDLADVLETLAVEGADAFYNGSLAQSIIDAVGEAGGNLATEDLENYRVHWRDPLTTTYHDQTVCTVPAPSGGPVFLSIISILEGFNLQPSERDDTLAYHRTIEAIKFGFAQKTRLGDPDYVTDVDDLTMIMLNKTAAEILRLKIDDSQTFPPEYYGPFFPKQDDGTSQVCVIDSDDNMVSFTGTIGKPFGSGVMTQDGILLNSVMADFLLNRNNSVNDSKANIIEPGKRSQSSMTPVISHQGMKTGQQYVLLGGTGGWRILNDVSQVYLNLFSYDLSLEEAVDRPRVQTKLYPDTVGYEDGIALRTLTGLRLRGHNMVAVSPYSTVTVATDRHNVMSAYSDPRVGGSGYVVL